MNSRPGLIGSILAFVASDVRLACLLGCLTLCLIGCSAEEDVPKPPAPAETQAAATDGDTLTQSAPHSASVQFSTKTWPGYTTELPGADASIPEWVGKRRDEPFDVRAFLESRRPPPDNAAPHYFPALAHFSAEMSFVFPDAEREQKKQDAAKLEELIGELSRADVKELASYKRSDLGRLVGKAAPLMSLFDDAQQRPQCVFVTARGSDAGLSYVHAARIFARLSRLQMIHASEHRLLNLAERPFARTLRLSRDLRRRGPMICHLVTFAMDAIVIDALRESLLPKKNVTTDHLDRLLAELRSHEQESVDPFSESIRMGYILAADVLDMMQQGRLTADETSAVVGSLPKEMVNYKVEWAALNRMFGLAIQHFDKPYHAIVGEDPVQKAIDSYVGQADAAFVKSKVEGTPFSQPTVTMMLLPRVKVMREVTARDETRVRATQALIAVRRYQILNRQNPPTLLDAIRAAGMKSIPIDPYSGQPLRYVVVDGKPIVYSVGSDQRDDGGRVDWGYGARDGDFLFQIGE